MSAAAATLRPAGPGDAEAVARIRVATWKVAYRGQLPDAYLDAMTPEQEVARRRQQLAEAAPGRGCLLALCEGEPVGFLNYGPCRDPGDEAAGEVRALYVLPERWGQGVGGALLEAAVAELAAAGFGRVRLWVLASNARTLRFYAHHGFALDGAAKVVERPGLRMDERRMTRGAG